jgi:outer membrane protein assembly factor BamD (BamD/ComL family)
MKKCFILAVLLLFSVPVVSESAYIFKNGKLIKGEEVATLSVQEHYSAAAEALEKGEWDELLRHARIVIRNFPGTPFADEAYYYMGVGYFRTEEFELSSRFLTKYLKQNSAPKFFEEAIRYKFDIAQNYRTGARKHLFGFESMPKWLPARDEAIAIYDEVITALPHHELAAQSLFGKAQLLLQEEEYKGSIDTYQTLIRRFSRHPLAADAYVGIAEVYLAQAQQDYPNPDFLDLAEINLRKFSQEFPGVDKLAVCEGLLSKMKEVYASDLYDTARFYERTKKLQAASIYYTRILAKYPQTRVALLASKRLSKLPSPKEPIKDAIKKEPSIETPSFSPLLHLQQEGYTVERGEEEAATHEATQ